MACAETHPAQDHDQRRQHAAHLCQCLHRSQVMTFLICASCGLHTMFSKSWTSSLADSYAELRPYQATTIVGDIGERRNRNIPLSRSAPSHQAASQQRSRTSP